MSVPLVAQGNLGVGYSICIYQLDWILIPFQSPWTNFSSQSMSKSSLFPPPLVDILAIPLGVTWLFTAVFIIFSD